jgi:hypothetical protein
MQKHTQTRHHPAITVLATEHIRSKKGATVGSTGSFSLLSTHQIDDVRVSSMKFTLCYWNGYAQ